MEIKLTSNTISDQDVDELCEFIKTKPRKLTYGKQVREFEESFSKKLGTKYSVLVNSGSSANLLMIAALIERGISKFNKKIVVPALSWATDIAPIMQLGLQPVLCDCNMQDLSVDVKHLEEIFIKESPSALLLVSVLGLVPNMDIIETLCDKYHVVLIEDNCESLMSEYHGIKLGNFGMMSSFSLFHSHHISTIEGGVITTNNEYLYEMLLMLRSHGWDREVSDSTKNALREKWVVSDFNSMYKFYVPGFNVRPTEITGFLGKKQLDKLDSLCYNRERNFLSFYKKFSKKSWKPISHGSVTSSFALPIISENRNEIVKRCKLANIECRPLISGSMSLQPFFVQRYGYKKMKNAEYIDKYGMYLPNHHDIDEDKIDYMYSEISDLI